MKQIKYTDKQELVLEILKPFIDLTYASNHSYSVGKTDLAYAIKDIKNKYGIKEKILTLREYLRAYSRGAYHHFIFDINFVKIDVIGVEDFERVYQPQLLDKYYVVRDITKEYGGDCTNYQCEHNLIIEPKED